MIDSKALKRIAYARLRDAQVLARANRYEGAVYLCGYAVELGLKARICKTLKWQGWPSGGKGFDGYQSFKTHDLDVLLHLSGCEERIKTKQFKEWSAVAAWDPQSRYNPIGTASAFDADLMIVSAAVLLAILLKR
jgi:hypothetical protein